MTQYIDKSAVAAEIKRIENETNYETFTDEVLGKRHVCKELLSFIDTLDVKEEVTTTDAFVKKACDWLTKHAKKYYFSKERYLGTDELVEDFKLSMEI